MKLLHGNGDVVSVLEDALARAKAGELVGVVVCGITDGDGLATGSQVWAGAYRDGVAFPWPRLLAVVETARLQLAQDGVADWS